MIQFELRPFVKENYLKHILNEHVEKAEREYNRERQKILFLLRVARSLLKMEMILQSAWDNQSDEGADINDWSLNGIAI